MAPSVETQRNQPDYLERAFKRGRELANPEAGDEIVISGISGFFPDSDNVRHFYENLLAKKDLTVTDERRWNNKNVLIPVPERMGKLKQLNKFDATFFGVPWDKAESMDPQGRLLLERTYEAIVDAGYHPKELSRSSTGVYVGTNSTESQLSVAFCDELHGNPHSYMGVLCSNLPNRISYWLDVTGPSYSLDANCSSCMYVFEHAYSAMRMGACNAAIIAGCNVCFHPSVSSRLLGLKFLSPDGRCKAFDDSADGYGRSEGLAVIFLQRKKDARRMYATVVHSKVNTDGYKEEGPHYPSLKMHQALLRGFYDECQVDPDLLEYIECHGTGTKVGDFIELNLLESIFFKKRKEPLKIGSVKSNIGHTESVSALCSIVKVILSFENDVILPNIHFKNFPSYVKSLKVGKFNVVTEPTPWNGGYAAINNFGFGGTNSHILMQSNQKIKANKGLPEDDLPRLVLISGRTEEAVDVILNDLEGRSLDAEYVGLYHEIYKYDINDHIYRGFTVLQKSNNERIRGIKFFSGIQKPVWFVYSGFGSEWLTMGKSLMKIPTFAESIQKCHNALISKDLNLINILTENDSKLFENIVNSAVGIIAVELALTDVLTAMNITPNGYVGYSIGELGCAYADGSVTKEEAIMLAYYYGVALSKNTLMNGAMVVVDADFNTLSNLLPSELDIISHNGPENYTVSGPEKFVDQFIKVLRDEEVDFKKFNYSNLSLHSRYLEDVESVLLQYARSIIKEPKQISDKWIGTSSAGADLNSDRSKYFSAEYLANNLLKTVLFNEAMSRIPENAIVIEVAPDGILQTLLTRSLRKNVNVALTSRNGDDPLTYFLNSVGRLYEAGITPRISKLYPPIQFPVSKGTPMISPLVRWDHSKDWFVGSYERYIETVRGHRVAVVTLNDKRQEYLSGHVVNGDVVYPAAGYLIMVWESLGLMLGKQYMTIPVVFQNIRFLRTTKLIEGVANKFTVVVHKNTNLFEIMENNDLVVTGDISVYELSSEETINTQPLEKENDLPLTVSDVYREFKLRGHDYKGLFQGITYTSLKGTFGRISWYDNFVCFIDALFQLQSLKEDQYITLPSVVQKLVINPQKHFRMLKSLDAKKPEFHAHLNTELDKVQSGGIEIEGIKFDKIMKNKPVSEKSVLEKMLFIPYIDPEVRSLKQAIKLCAQILMENSPSYVVQTLELVDSFTKSDGPLISQLLLESLEEIPSVQPNTDLIASDKNHPAIVNESNDLTVKDYDMPCDESSSMVIAFNILNRIEVLEKCVDTVNQYGFILGVENSAGGVPPSELKLDLCFDCTVKETRIVLLRKTAELFSQPLVVKISSRSFTWIHDVHKILATNANANLILLTEQEPLSGILGLFYCLRKEMNSENMRCFFIMDEAAPAFNTDSAFYRAQLVKNMTVNIYKNGKWGSYRHLLLENQNSISVAHAYVDCLVPGNLSTLHWLEGPLNPSDYSPISAEKVLIHVYYASLNSRDVILALGKRPSDQFFKNRIEKESTQGIEFVGKTNDGRRFMGITSSKSISNIVECNKNLLIPIPDKWSLEDAATVYFAYAKVIQALFIYGHMEEKQSVLIHSGASDIGLAAIIICLRYGCTIFVTVDSAEKREFIKNTFPSIPENHIGSANNKLFQKRILNFTNGEGVDLLLTTLAEENLQMSINYMAPSGQILQIGDFNELIDSLVMKSCSKDIGFHAIDIDFPTSKKIVSQLNSLVESFSKEGIIQPLPRAVFRTNEIRSAYRYFASGRSIGKVLVKIRDEESNLTAKPSIWFVDATPKYSCRSDRTYIVYDGLEDFGMELTDWLILRGARNLVLISKEGVTSGYQNLRVKSWKSYGANVSVSTDDMANEQEAQNLLKMANSSFPVSAIFILTEVLDDKAFVYETEKTCASSTKSIITSTANLDKLSRSLCPNLKHFVVFSSLSCSVGGVRQCNYAMCNSSVERICEERVANNLPALAVEWGAISNANSLISISEGNSAGEISQNDMRSCLELLDQFLKQPNPVVRSMSLSKMLSNVDTQEKSIVDTIVRILGLQDLKTISFQATLAEKGLDSLKVSEIRQSLEKNFNLFLTPGEIGNLTFMRLLEMDQEFRSASTT